MNSLSITDLANMTREEAIADSERLKREIANFKLDRIRIVRELGARIEAGSYKKFGYSNFEVWLADIGIVHMGMSLPDFKRKLHDVKALAKLPPEAVDSMPEGNRHELARMPPRMHQELLEPATSQKVEEFKETVALAKREAFGIQAPAERWKTHAVALPMGVYERVKACEAKVARMLQLDLEDDTKRARSLIDVWEAIAELINGTDEAMLKIEIIGGLEDAEKRTAD